MTYHTLFIDWDGTLSKSRFWGHWATDPQHSHKYQAIQQHFFQASGETIHAWMRGQLDAEQAIQIVAAKTGINAAELLKNLEHSCEQMTFIDPHLPQLLQKARRRGHKIVIATDNMDTFSRWTVQSLQLHKLCDDILNSHALGALKCDKAPDGASKFFASYLRQHNIPPHSSVLIDDGLVNKVVQDFGIHYQQITASTPATQIINDLLSA